MSANNTIIHKRSSVAGRVPVTANLALGEIAINTHDGKMFLRRQEGANNYVVQIGSGAVSNVYYVAKNGVDTNDGLSLSSPFLTIKAALAVATSGSTVFIKSGDYTEVNPVTIPAGVSLVGDNLRTVSIRPANPTSDIFYINNKCYITGVTFRDHVSPAAAVAYNPNGSAGNITTSPYVQNCSSITTTGTGMRIDGSHVTGGIRSMVLDAYTQFNEGGIGVHILNSGYAQLVSLFTICCAEAVLCESGGQCSITNSNSSFGNRGLVANGKSSLLFTANTVGSNPDIARSNVVVNGLSTNIPAVNDCFTLNNDSNAYYTISSTTPFVHIENSRTTYGQIVDDTNSGFYYAVGHDSYTSPVLTQISPDFLIQKNISCNVGNTLTGIVVNGDTIVVVGEDYSACTGTIFTVDTSVNPMVATQRAIGLSPQPLYSIACDANTGTYVAVGYNGVILTSNNAINWNLQTTSNIDALIDVTWNGSKFLITSTGIASSNTYTSNNGITWTNQGPILGTDVNSNLATTIFANNQFVVVAQNSDTGNLDIFTSNNAITWTKNTIPNNVDVEYIESITYDYNNSLFVITTSTYVYSPEFLNEKYILTSPSASSNTWTRQSFPNITDEQLDSSGGYSWRAASYPGKNTILLSSFAGMGANAATGGIIYSTDSVNWNVLDSKTSITIAETLPTNISANTTVQFYHRSFISASGHTFEYVGSGTTLSTALPQFGAVPILENQVVESDGGKVYYSSTDQFGNFQIGGELFFNSADGIIQGRTFNRSLFAVMTPYILALEG
jgi:hypothetical protein